MAYSQTFQFTCCWISLITQCDSVCWRVSVTNMAVHKECLSKAKVMAG